MVIDMISIIETIRDVAEKLEINSDEEEKDDGTGPRFSLENSVTNSLFNLGSCFCGKNETVPK